jgi:hypothetical protein
MYSGLRTFKYAPLLTDTADGRTYGQLKSMSAAVSSQSQITTAKQGVYGDDHKLYDIEEFVSGTLNLSFTDDPDDMYSDIIDMSTSVYSPEEGEDVTVYQDKSAPQPRKMGFGQILPKYDDAGAQQFVVQFIYSVSFAKSLDITNQTKNESITLVTPAVVGTIYESAQKTWRESATFPSEADANAFLTSRFTPAA